MALQQGLTKRRQPLSLGSVSPKGRTLRKADRVLLVGASEQVKRRSPEAFEEVVKHYSHRLHSASLRILRNPQDAEDAVQETFLKAFQSIGSFRGESSLYTWLYRIVQNQSLAKLRHRSQRRLIPIEACPRHFEQGKHVHCFQDRGQAPDLALYTRQLVEFLDQCIQDLPDSYRCTYVLKDVEKLSEDQVCEILGISKSTMKNRARRARLVVRKHVKKRFLAATQKRAPALQH